jgi:hypothetical protein
MLSERGERLEENTRGHNLFDYNVPELKIESEAVGWRRLPAAAVTRVISTPARSS